MRSWIANLPGPLSWLAWLLAVIVIVILLAVIVHALGGFDWSLHIGYLHLNLGVKGK